MNAVINAPRMPINYVEACRAITECARVDEVKEWRDRAAAIASYYKQKNDRTLFYQAERIKARASRRLGELLNQAAKALNLGVAAVAKQHGLKASDANQARSVARVPRDTFEEVVERRTPPMPVSGIARLAVTPGRVDDSAPIWKALARMDALMAEFPLETVVASLTELSPADAPAVSHVVIKAVEYWDRVSQVMERRLR